MNDSAVLLKRALLGFWAAWLSVVFLSNLADGLGALDLLPPGWPFASGNYALVAKTTARYHTPGWVNGLLFAGVIGWEGLAAGLFARACLTFDGMKGPGRAAVRRAFLVGLLLWGGFLLADEVCIAYEFEGTHLRLFVAQLVTLLVVELLSEGDHSP